MALTGSIISSPVIFTRRSLRHAAFSRQASLHLQHWRALHGSIVRVYCISTEFGSWICYDTHGNHLKKERLVEGGAHWSCPDRWSVVYSTLDCTFIFMA